mmetsp:Transcript_145417/g.464673  ORF Transcript_145417/g.464673 Transcript_145417/m.464673 type:complete len:111 (-) Transcript_145417:22-354(-)
MTALVHSAFSICRGSGLKTCLLDHRRRPWPCFFPWPFRDTLCGRSQTQALHDFSAALLRTVDHDLVLLASALPLKVFTLDTLAAKQHLHPKWSNHSAAFHLLHATYKHML